MRKWCGRSGVTRAPAGNELQVFRCEFRAHFNARFRGLLAAGVSAAILAFTFPGFSQVQNAPVNEPRRASSESATPVVKGAAAISQRREKCSTRLIVNADALFQAHRWTLNPDASRTLDVLGPMIAKAGKHPAQIFAETLAADSDEENRDVSHRRAVTVRTWLINHHFVGADTGVGESDPDKPVALAETTASPPGTERPRNNGLVKVVIDTCR